MPHYTPSTFKQWLRRLPLAEYRLVHFFSELAPKSYKTIARILQNPKGKLEAGSDGGMQLHGSSACLLLSSTYWPL
jgi:hypothetical protein